MTLMPILEMIFSRPPSMAVLKLMQTSRSDLSPGYQAALQAILEAFLGQVGVDRRGPDADQHREIVGVQALGRADDDRDVRAQALGDQVGVDAAGGQDHRQGHAVGLRSLVGQDDGAAAAQHRVLGLGPDAVEIGAQGVARTRLRGRQRHGAVDDGDVLPAQQTMDALVHAGGQDRAFQHVDIRLGGVLGQDVAEVLEPGLQAHHAGFPQGIDRRVGHLAEVLAEEVAERPVLFRQHGQGRVVAHRADGFLALLDHGARTISRSSSEKPAAAWRRVSSSRPYLRGSGPGPISFSRSTMLPSQSV
jgi:hypothetical protein